MAEKKFELTNLATGKKSTVEVKSGTIGPDVLNIANLTSDHGVFTFDPGFMATASLRKQDHLHRRRRRACCCTAAIPIEQLAEKSNFLEVAYLLINGELPTSEQLDEFTHAIQHHTMINESLLRFFNGFQYDAHPMAMLSAVVASMSAFYHDSMDIHNPRHREIFAHRIIAKIADDRRRGLQALARPAVHLSAQRSRLLREPAAHVLRGAVRAVRRRSR